MMSKFLVSCLFAALVLPPTLLAGPLGQEEPRLRDEAPDDPERNRRFVGVLASAVRHELMTLPYYNVFDWLEAEVSEDGRVVLEGWVVDGATRRDAEARMESIESVTEVVNNIEVLPPSPADDALRTAIYRAVFDFNSPLFRYATRAVPPIHIIVDNGRVTLKGVVASEADRQIAYTAARSVPGTFGVENELVVE